MTREETIAVLAESKRQNEVMRDNPSTFFVSHQMADGVKNAERRIVALDMALTAACPHCKQFPFQSKEVQVYDVVRVVCFKEGEALKDGEG